MEQNETKQTLRPKMSDTRKRKYINVCLVVVTSLLYGAVYILSQNEPKVVHLSHKKLAKHNTPISQPLEVHQPVVAELAVASKVEPVLEPAEVQTVVESTSEDSAEDFVSGSAPPANDNASQVSLAPKSKKHLKLKEKQKSDAELGEEVLAAADATLTEDDEATISENVLKQVGISKRQFLLIKMREQRLAKQMRDADEKGAARLKQLLVNDHSDWLKEYLGPGRYERFMELANR